MQFSISKLFTVALFAASAIDAQATSRGGRQGGRGRYRGKGKGRAGCATATVQPAAPALPTTFATVTVDATTTTTLPGTPSSAAPTADEEEVVVIETTAAAAPAVPETTTAAEPATPETTTTAAPQATEPAAAPLVPTLGDDAQKALAAHNAARAGGQLGAQAGDAPHAAEAQAWADHLAAIGSLTHSSGSERSGQGENLYWQSHGATPLINGANAWISEKSLYSYVPIGQGDFSAYGHYTQIVWRATTAVGIAGAVDSKGGVYVVARYAPAGNIIGQLPY